MVPVTLLSGKFEPPCPSSFIFTARVAIKPSFPSTNLKARVLPNSGRGGGIRTPIPGIGDRSPNRWTTPLYPERRANDAKGEFQIRSALQPSKSKNYFTSLCAVCLRQVLQNFFVSRRSLCFFLFFVVV